MLFKNVFKEDCRGRRCNEMRKVYSHYGNFTIFNKVARHAFAVSLGEKWDTVPRVWYSDDKVYVREAYPDVYEFVQTIKDSLDFHEFWSRARKAHDEKTRELVGYCVADWRYKGWKGQIVLTFERKVAETWSPVFTYIVDTGWQLEFQDKAVKDGFTDPKDLMKFIDKLGCVIIETPYGIRDDNINDLRSYGKVKKQKEFYNLLKDVENFDAIYDRIEKGKVVKYGDDE